MRLRDIFIMIGCVVLVAGMIAGVQADLPQRLLSVLPQSEQPQGTEGGHLAAPESISTPLGPVEVANDYPELGIGQVLEDQSISDSADIRYYKVAATTGQHLFILVYKCLTSAQFAGVRASTVTCTTGG